MPEPQYMSFESWEEAYEFMRKGEDYGNRNLHAKQTAITWGDHWVRFYDVADRFIIFGYIYTQAEAFESEAKGIAGMTDPGEQAMARSEVEQSMRTIRDAHERGLMWGWAYSKDFTDIGSTHRFNMWPISEGLFEAAKAVGWDVDAITDPDARTELEGAWQEYRAHQLAVMLTGDQP